MKSIHVLFLTLLCGLPSGWCAAAEEPPANDATTRQQSPDEAVEAIPDESSSASLSGVQMLAPELLTADGDLDIGKAPDYVPFTVNYPSFGPGHRVTLRWNGAATFTSPVQTTTTVSPLKFSVPKTTIAASFGSVAAVTYTVEIPGAPAMTSEPLNINVVLGALPAPTSPLLVDGKLDIGKAPLQLPFTVTFPSLAAGERVTLNWQGSTPYKTAAQATTSTAPLTFTVPREVIAKDLGQSATLTYTVEIAGVPAKTSLPLTMQVQFNLFPPPRFPLSTGIDSAKRLNSQYADVPARCDNDAPAYYCSGIFLRGVTDGNFDPWNPSPSAARLGAQSFSFVRSDANMKSTFVASGYILSTPSEAIKQSKPVRFLCVYPYNAGTSGMTPLGRGCNASATIQPSPNDDLSTCAAKNATTVDSWLTYTRTNAQCSLSMKDPDQFMTMLGARAASPGNTSHNEVMVETWAQDVAPTLPLEAFFYSSAAGLNAAKSFQYKFKVRTGTWLPILRLDLTQSSPFAYESSDQWTQP